MMPAKTHPAPQTVAAHEKSPSLDLGYDAGKRCPPATLLLGKTSNQEAERHVCEKRGSETAHELERACKARNKIGHTPGLITRNGDPTAESTVLKQSLQLSTSQQKDPLGRLESAGEISDGKMSGTSDALSGYDHAHTPECTCRHTTESSGNRAGGNYVHASSRRDSNDHTGHRLLPAAAKLHNHFSIIPDESKVSDPLQAQKEANSLRNKSLVSFLDEAYGCFCHQVGYRTDGHQCIDLHDREEAFQTGSSLLYGELLPHGVTIALDRAHLDASTARTLYDFGMGTGKLALQAFLQYPSLKRVVGIEIAFSRYKLGERALLSITTRYSTQFTLVNWEKNERIVISTTSGLRTLEFRRCDLLHCTDAEQADIAILQTDFQEHTHDALGRLLQRLSRGARVLTYMNLRRIWDCSLQPFPFTQFALQSRLPTSWSSKTGHLFFLWRKSLPNCWLGQPHLALVEGKTQNESEETREKEQAPRHKLWQKCKAIFSFFARSNRKRAKLAQSVTPHSTHAAV